MVLQVIIPMAGIGSRFKEYGFKVNKYLLPINTNLTYMIELAIISLSINVPCKYFFIINEEKGYDLKLRGILTEICKKKNFLYDISSVGKLTEGPACTVNTIRYLLDMNEPLLISNSDQVLNWNFNNFLNSSNDFDGCVLTYKPDYPLIYGSQDKHSFVHINLMTGKVDECREKLVLSDKALVGTHFIKKAYIYFECYDYMIQNNITAPNGEFYISLVYQSMLENNYTVTYYNLNENMNETYYAVGEPNDYFNYLYIKGNYISTIKTITESPILLDDDLKIEYIQNFDNFTNENENEKIIDLNTYQINYFNMYDKDVIKITSDNIKKNILQIYILRYRKEEKIKFFYNIEDREIYFLLDGKMKINNINLNKHELFILDKNEVFCPIFLEDCYLLKITKEYTLCSNIYI